MTTTDALRDAINDLPLYVVVGEEDVRTVRNRNRTARPRLLDAVLLDDLWDLLDDAAFSEGAA